MYFDNQNDNLIYYHVYTISNVDPIIRRSINDIDTIHQMPKEIIRDRNLYTNLYTNLRHFLICLTASDLAIKQTAISARKVFLFNIGALLCSSVYNISRSFLRRLFN